VTIAGRMSILPRMALNLYNTLTKQVEPFAPIAPDRVTFYTCGPTVYDYAHIGNFRSFLAADVLPALPGVAILS
jgi:cysteinyl-tRNA synthetase